MESIEEFDENDFPFEEERTENSDLPTDNDLETEINPTLGVDSNNKPNKCEKCNKPLFNKNSFDWTSKRSSRQVETL